MSNLRSVHRVALVGFGTAGDIHPLLSLGRSLQARGHAPVLLANPVFQPQAHAARLGFRPVGTAHQQEATLSHPRLWHPVDGLGVLWRYLLRPALEPTYATLRELAAGGPLIVFSSPLAMGARVAQEKLGLPLVSLYTSPTLLRTLQDPMTLARWRVPRWLPRSARQCSWSLLDRFKLEPLVRPALDVLRAGLGLAPVPGPVFGRWMHSPQAGLALFPRWFAPAPSDWPRQVRQSGFALWDDTSAPLDPPVAAFLDAGPPPIVVMPGTGQRSTAAFFDAAVAACTASGERALLLGTIPHDLPSRLPASVHAAPYAPFHRLLPRARALVHHGGAGTCAQALRAGVPQLVLPAGYDQHDNAMRLELLGVARAVRGGPRPDRLIDALRSLLADEGVHDACRRHATFIQLGPCPHGMAASLVEELSR